MAKISIMLDTENVNCVASIDNNIVSFDGIQLSKYSYLDYDGKMVTCVNFNYDEDVDDPVTGMKEKRMHSWNYDSRRGSEDEHEGSYSSVHGLKMLVTKGGIRNIVNHIVSFFAGRKKNEKK